MTPIQIVFGITFIVTLGAAALTVLTRNMVHAALWLILSLFGVAVLYVLLHAGFLAVAQVVVYIGAISILLIFAVMLTRRIMSDTGPQHNGNWPWAVLIAVVIFGGLVWVLSAWSGFTATAPLLSPRADPLVQLGQALVSPNAYVIAFEVASVLLLAALIGAIIVAWERR
jgi:NADH-quinone oxidoreductase subunit J